MSSVILSWGKQGNEMKHIEDVDNGLNCNCICPQCNGALIARNRGEVRTSHFAHATDIFCEGAEETSIHKAAKQIVSNSRIIQTPKFDLHFIIGNNKNLETIYHEISNRRLTYDHAKEEVIVRNFRPDVEISVNGRSIYTEITVTNETKKSKIIDFQRNYDILFEISLPKIECRYLSKDEFIEKVLFDTKNRKWLLDLDNVDLVTPKIKELINKLTRIQKRNYYQYLTDLLEFRSTKNIYWRLNRDLSLRNNSKTEVERIYNTVDFFDYYYPFFRTLTHDYWILDVHSTVWQFAFIRKFISDVNRPTYIHTEEVAGWLENKYELTPFLKRLISPDSYFQENDFVVKDLMNIGYKSLMGTFFKSYPNYQSLSENYLSELCTSNLLTKMGRNYFSVSSEFKSGDRQISLFD